MKRLAFSDDMMRALAAGEKTMTRRPAKTDDMIPPGFSGPPIKASRFHVGDLVAATCAHWINDSGESRTGADYRFQRPGWEEDFGKARPARVMPAARAPFVLLITEVRAERLGEITNEDALREGMYHWGSRTLLVPRPHAPVEVFGIYWNQLYGRKPLVDAWSRDRNSWVWVYGFEIAERRI